ncbi:DUF4395 domain-containing protein [Microbacterium sediminis]|uniref:Uncharacterized protein n=1 Tax=Microbacterium sediminis TaxID=904291 RepID=A0A1B9NB78_9MICO|nr:DUF4395 domain-containing protein [Microbacterium sediminis]OCG73849.1 hypothetical protein A7J15_06410 [Microbacterium sediminis]QBR74595.1 DUF4395 domain-containing protein [Microbacterium sediminis]
MSDAPAGIDPRGPRFAAAITAALLLVATFLALIGISTWRTVLTFGWLGQEGEAVPDGAPSTWALPVASLTERIADPGFLAVLVVALLFLWGVVSPRTAPWGVVFRRLVRPRLAPPAELEDPRPPRFAQGVGLFVTGVGLVLHLLGVPLALPIASAAAFIAAFLNAAFAFCLGCQMYLGLQRVGLVGRAA